MAKNLQFVTEEEFSQLESVGHLQPPEQTAPIVPGQPQSAGSPPTPHGRDPYGSGVLPSNLGLQPDLVKTGEVGSIPSFRLMPVQNGPVVGAIVQSTVTKIVNKAIAAIPPAPTPIPAVGDGLTHGDPVWEHDSAYVELRDEFHGTTAVNNSSAVSSSGIGELGWFLAGSVGSNGGVQGGVPPYIGQYSWENNSVAKNAGYLILGSVGGSTNANHIEGTWALAESPGWKMTWVFKVEGDIQGGGGGLWGTTKKSIYIGLCGPTLTAQLNVSARPDVFIGLRYDTSATSPAISDSFYTLEVVANHSWSTAARHNTQGTTYVTNVAPIQGVWHRIDIICSVAGKVTITLDESSTNTLTATIPTFSFTTGIGTVVGRAANGIAAINWTAGAASDPPESPWGAGSSVTINGFSGAQAPINGTFTLADSQNVALEFDLAGSIGASGNTSASTISGYPSLMPCCIFGNDDTVGPTALTMCMTVDFFSFVWNPNLGPSTPGTPNSAKARYW